MQVIAGINEYNRQNWKVPRWNSSVKKQKEHKGKEDHFKFVLDNFNAKMVLFFVDMVDIYLITSDTIPSQLCITGMVRIYYEVVNF